MVTYNIYRGIAVRPFVDQISLMRITEFEPYPYLYKGTQNYEREYMMGFSNEPKSCLVVATEAEKVVGVLTAMPLKSEATILNETEDFFRKNGLDPNVFFYLGEFIVIPEYRRKGISKKMEDIVIAQLRKWNYSWVCIATVYRPDSDPRKPKNYLSQDRIWIKLGYSKMNISTQYDWPTILENGEIKNISNTLIYWKKEII